MSADAVLAAAFGPWALSAEQEQAILSAREKTNWGPMRLTWLTGRPRSTPMKVAQRHASFSIHSPILRIRPVSSAAWMNSTGWSRPRSGCCQRTSASWLKTLPLFASTIGW